MSGASGQYKAGTNYNNAYVKEAKQYEKYKEIKELSGAVSSGRVKPPLS